jgi:microcystin-dependent protein
MASSYTTSLKIQQMGNGEDSGTWGTITNTNWALIEQAVAGVQSITMANANYTLSNLNGISDEARNMVLVIGGTSSVSTTPYNQVVAPLVPKFYVITNNTAGGNPITIGASTGSIITVPNGTTVQVYCDGTNFYSAQTSSAGNFNVNGNLSVGGNLTVSGSSTIVPAGVIQMWPTATAPAGFLLCTGAAVSRTTYAALFAVVGTTFGAGDGSTTFNLPNYQDRMPIGAGTIAASIGATGGSKDATLVSHAHGYSGTTGGMNANNPHNHSGGDSGHYHNLNTDQNAAFYGQSTGGGGPYAGYTGGYAVELIQPYTEYANANIYINNQDINHGHAYSGTTDTQGASGTNANLPPYLGINFIIKT